MTANPNKQVSETAEQAPRSSLLGWGPPAALAVAFLALFRVTITNMALRWEDPTFSHGWIVAPAALAIAWYKRDTWLYTPARPAVWSGLAVILVGLLSMIAATAVSVLFIPYLSMLVVVGGMIVYFGGWALLRHLAFPYAFLFFMVPWPDFLVEAVSFPMQLGTSAYSTLLASVIGIPVVRDGVNLAIPPVNARFEVAVACSGMHSLVALMCLGAGFAFFTPAALWKRWLIFGLSLPMAFAANVFRVFLILCVAYWISPTLAAKAFHDWSSPVLFIINTMGLIAIRNAMMREPKRAAAVAPASGVASGEDDDAF